MTGVGYTGWHCSSPYFLAELPLRLLADATPSRPLIDYAAKWRIYISIHSSFDLVVHDLIIRDANHRRPNRRVQFACAAANASGLLTG